MSDQPQQLLREFARYKQLLRRPNIAQALQSERETLLVRLLIHLEQIEEDFENRSSAVDIYRGSNNRNSNGRNQPPTGKNTSFCVNFVVWGKQLRNKDTLKAASTMFSDLDSFEELKDRAEALHDKLEKWVTDQVRDWQEKIEDQLNNDELSVQVSGRLMEIHHDSGNMIVNYSESLAELLRDTRQLSGLGYAIPKAIQRAAKDGEKYFRYAVQLKKVANFINTMESQIILLQKQMLLQSLLDFDEYVKGHGNKNGNDVTWSEPGECERYVGQLLKSADNISRENRRLRHAHLRMVDATLALMNTDILRQKERWTSLGYNQSLLQSLKDSPYYKAFADEGSTYEQKFALLDEVLHAINSIQRKWVYLEPIFGRGALPQEQGWFKKVDEDFRDNLIRLEGDKTIFSLVDDSIYSRIQENVQQMLSQLERYKKALADFLEEKRSAIGMQLFVKTVLIKCILIYFQQHV